MECVISQATGTALRAACARVTKRCDGERRPRQRSPSRDQNEALSENTTVSLAIELPFLLEEKFGWR